MYRYIKVIVVGAALVIPVTVRADDHEDRRRHDEHSRRYEDRGHHDFHAWNEGEDRAYRRYLEEHHRKYHDFEKARRREQDDYWNWRHIHPD